MRDYDKALSQLETFSRLLAADVREETLGKIQIVIRRDAPIQSGEADLVGELEKLIRADLQKYTARVIQAAQDEVRAAADALRDAIDTDLKSNLMRD